MTGTTDAPAEGSPPFDAQPGEEDDVEVRHATGQRARDDVA